MRDKFSMAVERGRVLAGEYGSAPFSTFGAFRLKGPAGVEVLCIVADDAGWDHVSASLPGRNRCPTWEEMCWVKGLFFRADECVMQLHPPEADWVNHHPYVLHLYRPQTAAVGTIPRPPAWTVGPKAGQSVEEMAAEARAALRDDENPQPVA